VFGSVLRTGRGPRRPHCKMSTGHLSRSALLSETIVDELAEIRDRIEDRNRRS